MTELIPELLDLVDNSVLKEKDVLQIALRPAVELSYLKKEEQADLFKIIGEADCTPSHAQAIKMRQLSESKKEEERLDKDVFVSIMQEKSPIRLSNSRFPKNESVNILHWGRPRRKSRTPS